MDPFVRRLLFTLVFVKAGTRLAPKHLAVTQPEQHGRNVIAASVSFLERVANINGNIDADFIDQPQRSHRHPPLHQRGINFVRFEPSFEKLSGVEQIWKQNPVDQKTRAVAHDHRQFSDLSHEGQAPLARLF